MARLPIATAVLSALLMLIQGSYLVYRQRRAHQKKQLQLAEDDLNPILKDFTCYRPYTTAFATYPRIRTFYRPHAHKDKHADVSELPLLVFIHGVGGVLPQFAPVLRSLTTIAPCFGIELPGHGRSTFAPTNYEAYTIEANVALWKAAIEDICHENNHKSVVLIGHSMGCSISALLASTTTTAARLTIPVVGIVSVCPRTRQLTDHEIRNIKKLKRIPNVFLNILRYFDRRGGENSRSVYRVVGESNESDLKRMQLQWNRQFRTSVLKRIMLGLLPRTGTEGQVQGGYPSEAVWQGLRAPLFLMAGEADTVTPPQEVDSIVQHITKQSLEHWKDRSRNDAEQVQKAATNDLMPTTIKYIYNHLEDDHESVIQAITLPKPAAHALLYAHTTYRLVSALVEAFLAAHVSHKLDLGYQLQLLTTSGKWDVKNLQKWKAVLPVSGPIHTIPPIGSKGGLFRALKTLREQDDEHNPEYFLKTWSDKIYAVIDISKDTPIYNTKSLEKGGVEYHKFPTVSKIPPTPIEVQDFCTLIDKLIAERDAKESNESTIKSIAVHCHYGYNRTGFFICSYLIARCGYGVQQAIDEFAKAKPPGIRHEHFIDTLWLRFAAGVQQPENTKRSETLSGKMTNSRRRELTMSTTEDSEQMSGYLTEGDLM